MGENGNKFGEYIEGNLVKMSIVSTHPDIAKQWHPRKNGDLKPEQFTFGSDKKVWWLCPNICSHGCLHEWESPIKCRCRQGTGCVYCSTPIKKSCEHMSILYTHPEIAKQWHPTKNGDLKVTDVTSGCGYKVWWLCPKTCPEGCLHEYESRVVQRCMKGSGCHYCVENTMKTCIHTSIAHTHPEVSKLWHPTKNGELLSSEVTQGCHKKIWWLCPNKCSHGCLHEWQTSIYHLTTDTGCPFCSNRKLCEHMSILYTHREIAKEWHPTKNVNLDIKLCSIGCNKSIWWVCKKGHEYQQLIYSKCGAGQGCPQCKNKTEELLLIFLKKYCSDMCTQLKLESCISLTTGRYYRFDFYTSLLKLIIELDGPQHFKQVSNWMNPEDSIKRDVYKMQKAETAGYKVIRIFQPDVYDRNEKWLEENLLPHILAEDRNHVFISSIPRMYDSHKELYNRKVQITLEDATL